MKVSIITFFSLNYHRDTLPYFSSSKGILFLCLRLSESNLGFTRPIRVHVHQQHVLVPLIQHYLQLVL